MQPGAEKVKIKYLLGKLTRGLMVEISHRTPTYGAEIKNAIEKGMEQAIAVEEYNKEDFELYYPLDETDLRGKTISIEPTPRPVGPKEYFIWNLPKDDLKEVVRLLLNDYDCLRSQNDFHSLFEGPDVQTKIKWNASKIDLLILLFDFLLSEEIVEIKRGKGYWKVLKYRLVDFDKNPLSGNFAKRLDKLNQTDASSSVVHSELEQIKSTLFRKS